jgi:hypothetical protein
MRREFHIEKLSDEFGQVRREKVHAAGVHAAEAPRVHVVAEVADAGAGKPHSHPVGAIGDPGIR